MRCTCTYGGNRHLTNLWVINPIQCVLCMFNLVFFNWISFWQCLWPGYFHQSTSVIRGSCWPSFRSAINRKTTPWLHQHLRNFFKCRVETSINDHSRESTPDLEKYKVVQFLPAWEEITHEDCIFIWAIYSLKWYYYEYVKPKVGLNILPMFRVYHNRSF